MRDEAARKILYQKEGNKKRNIHHVYNHKGEREQFWIEGRTCPREKESFVVGKGHTKDTREYQKEDKRGKRESKNDGIQNGKE